MEKTTKLFRTEALDKYRQKEYGEIFLARSISEKYIILFVAALALITLFILIEVPYTKKVAVRGSLQQKNGLIQISTIHPGVISKVNVTKGQKIHKGDTLFIIENDVMLGNGYEAIGQNINLIQEKIQNLNADLSNQDFEMAERQKYLQNQISSNQQNLKVINEQIQLQAQSNLLEKNDQERNSFLYKSGMISESHLNQRRQELLKGQIKLAELDGLKIANKNEYDKLTFDIHALKNQAMRKKIDILDKVKAYQQELNELQAKKGIKITSNSDGVVGSINVIEGQTINENTILTTVIPEDSELEAVIKVNSKSIAFIKVGQHVNIMYESYPYQQYGQHNGIVYEIDAVPLKISNIETNGVDDQYLVKVKLENQFVIMNGEKSPLKTGMLFDSRIVLNEVKLYELILQPLFAIYGRK